MQVERSIAVDSDKGALFSILLPVLRGFFLAEEEEEGLEDNKRC